MPKQRILSQSFEPASYSLDTSKSKGILSGRLKITGRKIGRPSHRLTFHQSGLSVINATITKIDRKGVRGEMEIRRINHHRKFDEVRLHTKEMLYPGNYEIELEYLVGGTKPPELKMGEQPSRIHMPMIDEAGVRAEYSINPKASLKDAKD